MEQCCGPLTVEIVPGKHFVFSTYLAKRAKAQPAHAQRCNFLIIKQSCVPLRVEKFPGQHCDFSTYLSKRARAQAGACAEVKFSDYGTVL
jgi:hypothetical protein